MAICVCCELYGPWPQPTLLNNIAVRQIQTEINNRNNRDWQGESLDHDQNNEMVYAAVSPFVHDQTDQPRMDEIRERIGSINRVEPIETH